jgi:hypothetical protein
MKGVLPKSRLESAAIPFLCATRIWGACRSSLRQHPLSMLWHRRGREAAEHLPITDRVNGDIEGSNGASVGALLPHGWPGQLTVCRSRCGLTTQEAAPGMSAIDTDAVLPPHRQANGIDRTIACP